MDNAAIGRLQRQMAVQDTGATSILQSPPPSPGGSDSNDLLGRLSPNGNQHQGQLDEITVYAVKQENTALIRHKVMKLQQTCQQ